MIKLQKEKVIKVTKIKQTVKEKHNIKNKKKYK